jgi:alanyl-tRNA synthetase
MNAEQIRNEYLNFFKDRGHTIIPRAKLVPYNDPTTLFTGSGMQPLIPYLLGEEHPGGVRLADSQTCIRAQDIEEVGDRTHTTFFEMLGNWSLGDYTKEQQITWFWEFLTEKIGLNPEKIYVTCFIGNDEYGVPRDDEAAAVWQKLFAEKGIEAKIVALGSQKDGDEKGVQDGRIFFYDDGENWWSRNGGIKTTPIGDPCGPDSEVFYDFGEQNHDPSFGLSHPASDGGRFMEIGNQVFMQYRRNQDGSFSPLEKQNIDYGGGLERIAAASIDSPDVYKISLLWPIIEKLEALSDKKYEAHTNAMRVIADHLRGATFLAVDGIKPSNKEQGYVMRRLLRRAIRFAFDLGIEQNFFEEIVPVIADLYHEDYPEVAQNRTEVIETLIREEKVFRQTLRKGLKEFSRMFAQLQLDEAKQSSSESLESSHLTIGASKHLQPESKATSGLVPLTAGEVLFTLYDTYGFPVELSVEEAYKQGIELGETWRQEFDAKMKQQRERSQTAAKGTFKGGLGGQTLQHKKYHTATHLMYQALRDVLGSHVVQRGSNITEERLRFDFSHPEKVTPEQLKKVEDIVNEQIAKDLKVSYAEYPTKVAIEEKGALGQFGDRYGDTVKVYKMIADDTEKPFSFEICGGPHVDHTLQLFEDGKKFKIIKEEASSAGVRRIKAVLI